MFVFLTTTGPIWFSFTVKLFIGPRRFITILGEDTFILLKEIDSKKIPPQNFFKNFFLKLKCNVGGYLNPSPFSSSALRRLQGQNYNFLYDRYYNHSCGDRNKVYFVSNYTIHTYIHFHYNIQGGRGHWTVYYTSPQSFIIRISYSLTQIKFLVG